MLSVCIKQSGLCGKALPLAMGMHFRRISSISSYHVGVQFLPEGMRRYGGLQPISFLSLIP